MKKKDILFSLDTLINLPTYLFAIFTAYIYGFFYTKKIKQKK